MNVDPLTRLRLYFAGPLFNEAERQFNERLCAKIEEMGISVFLPQRDGLCRHMEQTIACEKKGSTDMKAENKAFLRQIIKDGGGPTWDIDSVNMKAENKAFLRQIIKDGGGPTWDIDSVNMKAENKAFLEQLREPPKENRSKVIEFFQSFKSKLFSKNFHHPEK